MTQYPYPQHPEYPQEPYQGPPPQYLPYAQAWPPRRPGVVTWFFVYCGLMALIYLTAVVVAFVLMSHADQVSSRTAGREDVWLRAILLAVIGIPLAIAFGAAPFLPRRPWVWIYHIVLICIGLTSCLFWAICIPLLIFWIRPETKAWYGRSP